MSTGPGKQAAAESIGTSPRAFEDDSDMMGRMGLQAQETPRKKGNWIARINFGIVALASKVDGEGSAEPKPAATDTPADRG
jgi:hypothetical protein